VSGRELFVQEYGKSNSALLDGLRARGAKVHTVPVYGWAMPLDTTPLAAAIDTLCGDHAEVITFTSAQQLEHLFQLAAERGQDAQLLAALQQRIVCASIGPVTSEALKARNIAIDLEPEHPKMGHLATAVGTRGRQLAQAKRAQKLV
jgi:uroporphyrinogen-III synthase